MIYLYPDLTECRRYFHDIRYTLYFLWWFLNVQMPEVEFKTKPRNKQKPSQICKCLVFFAGHSCTFSICVITSRNLVLVPAIIISLIYVIKSSQWGQGCQKSPNFDKWQVVQLSLQSCVTKIRSHSEVGLTLPYVYYGSTIKYQSLCVGIGCVK